MKKLLTILPLVILLCFTFACQKKGEEIAEEAVPAVNIEAEKAAVKTLIDDFVTAWETEDLELFSKIIAHDNDMIMFGTDAAEHFVGWESMLESMKKQLDASENVQITTRDLSIKVHKSGEVAWVSFLMDLEGKSMGEPFRVEGVRVTAVLEKRNGNWLFVQFHASIPVAGQAVKY